jgi:hypothetical protein
VFSRRIVQKRSGKLLKPQKPLMGDINQVVKQNTWNRSIKTQQTRKRNRGIKDFVVSAILENEKNHKASRLELTHSYSIMQQIMWQEHHQKRKLSASGNAIMISDYTALPPNGNAR